MFSIISEEVEKLIAAQVPDLVRIRRDLHAHPQLGFEETLAADVVRRELTLADVPFQAGVATTGVIGWLTPASATGKAGGSATSSNPGGDAIALRADMDALPIQEETGLPYASEVQGRMHACGHDGHTAILIGAARVLARLRERLPRPVKFLFQPAEEGKGGGRKMLEAGALEDRVGGVKVGAIFGLHGWSPLPVGTIGTRKGPLMAGADVMDIVIHGRGGHGAIPHKAADPVVAAAHVVTALQTVISRNTDPAEQAVVTVSQFHAGTAFNIIPESARLSGTIRTLDEAVTERVHRRVSAIAQHVASGLDCSADVNIIREYPVTMNAPAATDFVLRVAADVLGADRVTMLEKAEMGSEDFSFFAARVPACYFFLGLRPPGAADYPGAHSPRFDFNDEAILPGVRMMVGLALAAGTV